MGTHSTIALEHPDGKIDQIYCHYDGYIEWNGKVLFEYYSTFDKVKQLIELGCMSVLKDKIGEKHDFNVKSDCCKFYGRDRDELGCEAERFEDYLEYLSGEKEAYNYILRHDGNWYVQHADKKFSLLSDCLRLITSNII